jgi:glycosyltransferase involved in cell wall biosynthesis
MKIGLDARFITRYPRRGIGNYSLNTLVELIRLSPENEFILYIFAPDKDQELPRASNVTVRRLSSPSYLLWEQIGLSYAAFKDRLDVLHCLGNTAPLMIPSSVKLILTLHDVMFLLNGAVVPTPTNHYQVLGRLYRRYISPRAARLADQVITVSDFSRRDIIEMIPGLDPASVHVTYQSCDNIFKQVPLSPFVRAAHGVGKQPYIFALGADDPRKNTLRLVKAYLKLLQRYEIQHDLVISGYSNWKQSEAYNYVKIAGAIDKVKFLSFISTEELAEMYRNATLFVYPSLYEGFGIPLLEAFSSGCPVIASNVTSIPEVGADAAIYVDPLNEDEISAAIYRLIQDDDLRYSLIQRGHARALNFSWAETARQTLSVYKHCMSMSG